MSDGFSIFVDDNPFEGALICSFVSLLLFAELAQLGVLSKIQRRDARFQAKQLAKILRTMETESLKVFAGGFLCLKQKIEDAEIEIAGRGAN